MHELSAEKNREIRELRAESIVLFYFFFFFFFFFFLILSIAENLGDQFSRAMKFDAISVVGIINRAARWKCGTNDLDSLIWRRRETRRNSNTMLSRQILDFFIRSRPRSPVLKTLF